MVLFKAINTYARAYVRECLCKTVIPAVGNKAKQTILYF